MKFKYTQTLSTNLKGGFTKRPILELEITKGSETVDGLALIDSGADSTMMNIEYAKALGIDLTNLERKSFIGIGRELIECYVSLIEMKIKQFKRPILAQVAFTDSPNVNILLGQEDFFEKYQINFNRKKDLFEII